MTLRKRLFNPFLGAESKEPEIATRAPDAENPVESKVVVEQTHETDQSSDDERVIDEKAQAGTQKAQAASQAWTRNTLIAAYIL